MHVAVLLLRSMSMFSVPSPSPHVSVVSFSVSPDDGSGPEVVSIWKILDNIIIINKISDNFY